MIRAKSVGLGAGGHAKGILEILGGMPNVVVVGLLDADPRTWGDALLGATVLGGDAELPRLFAEGVDRFFNAIGGTRSTSRRREAYQRARAAGMVPLDVRHPSAIVSRSAHLGAGIAILAGAVVGPCVTTGENVLINTGAIVEHDCKIGDHAHVAIGARLGGNVELGPDVLVGAGATILQGVRIGEKAVVGAGGVVLCDVPSHTVVVGVPAREMRKVEDE